MSNHARRMKARVPLLACKQCRAANKNTACGHKNTACKQAVAHGQGLAARRARPFGRRRGAVLVAAIVCLAVASMIFVSIVKMAANCRRVADTQSREVQAGWLAESGLERAAARLDAEEDYSGETWTIPATDLAGRDGAVVVVEVLPVDGRPRRRLVRARADYPNDSHHRARQTREVVVPLQ